ncbi:anthranilate synthase component I family protein [Dubosiella newyorkensis]|uniref:anthranilate synthase component I family protein n=2 Tax=Dubosiella newyorkensis TaxID=1862672 RepID=UPI0023F45AB2|nr:chorismate-binding protein [Dubosiella newyorkensis]
MNDLYEIQTIYQQTHAKRIPLIKTIEADQNAIDLFQTVKAGTSRSFLLESSIKDRYSYMGYEPQYTIQYKNETLTIHDRLHDTKTHQKTTDPKQALQVMIDQQQTPNLYPFFCGGLVGYFAYESLRCSEPKLRFSKQTMFNDFDLAMYDTLIAYDHYEHKIHLISGIQTNDLETNYKKAQKQIEELETKLHENEITQNSELFTILEDFSLQFEKPAFIQNVTKAKQYIQEGDIFQVVLSNRMQAKVTGSLFSLYQRLRIQNPSPYLFYANMDDLELAGASPETLIAVHDRQVMTYPLAGTRPRGKNEQEDQQLEYELKHDPKEKAEHDMLVDLGRNDLGKICKNQTIHVSRYQDIVRFSTLMHLASTIQGELLESAHPLDALFATLPAGTLSGAPKFRACQIIQELEQSERGIYGGAFGYIDFSQNLDFCIGIRLAYKKEDQLYIRSGAGIVADSDPEREFQECHIKASSILQSIQKGAHYDLAH